MREHAGHTMYRAVIVREHGGVRVTDVVGPYLTQGQAEAQITRQKSWWKVVESTVEVAHPDWKPVS